MRTKVIDNLSSITNPARQKVLLLYSGGLDSIYTAFELVSKGVEVYALYVQLGKDTPPDLEDTAKKIGIHLKQVDSIKNLCNSYITKGILANGLYNGRYPISSSYTRPLMAYEALRYAREIGVTSIVHSATPLQNSASRFNMSLIALADIPIRIYCPAITDYLSRVEKSDRLQSIGIKANRDSTYISVDENIWARVMESGIVDQTHNNLPEDIFQWTKLDHSAEKTIEIEVEFNRGYPVKLNGKAMEFSELISFLNEKIGPYGVGRYSGFEENSFGIKVHEVRETPAGHILHESHKLLEEMVLTQEELRVKHILDREWTNLVVGGGWYSPLRCHLDEFMKVVNHRINGVLRWSICENKCWCSAKQSTNITDCNKVGNVEEDFLPFTLSSFYAQMARKHKITGMGG
ncbi:MAG: argininosuccinate synthase domain-containing protein [Bacillota bacterium]